MWMNVPRVFARVEDVRTQEEVMSVIVPRVFT
jgi:hypothetical protein